MTRQVTQHRGNFPEGEISGDARFLCKAVAGRVITKVITQGNNIIPQANCLRRCAMVHLRTMRITRNP